MSKSFPTPSKTFFILFFLHLFLSLVLRLTGQLEQRISMKSSFMVHLPIL